MPKTLQILEARPYPVEGYGYLYTFLCQNRKGDKFLRMSQIFEGNPVNLNPNKLYDHFSSITNERIKPIININRSAGRDEDWGVDQAIAYADKRREEQRAAKELAEQKEKERGEPATQEEISKIIEEWKKRQGNKNLNWYKSAKFFVKNVVTSQKR
jgi:hypothetical protein